MCHHGPPSRPRGTPIPGCPVQLPGMVQARGQSPGVSLQADTGGDHVTNQNTWSREEIPSVTLSLFPGLCAAVKSNSDDEFTKTWFSPVLTMLLYNVGDTMGRLSTSLVAIKPSRKKTIMILSSCRVIFWLLFPICNIDRIGGNVQTLITEDWIYALLMLLFRSVLY